MNEYTREQVLVDRLAVTLAPNDCRHLLDLPELNQLSAYTSSLSFNNSACASCSNNPKNGGSGACNCILGVGNYF